MRLKYRPRPPSALQHAVVPAKHVRQRQVREALYMGVTPPHVRGGHGAGAVVTPFMTLTAPISRATDKGWQQQ